MTKPRPGAAEFTQQAELQGDWAGWPVDGRRTASTPKALGQPVPCPRASCSTLSGSCLRCCRARRRTPAPPLPSTVDVALLPASAVVAPHLQMPPLPPVAADPGAEAPRTDAGSPAGQGRAVLRLDRRNDEHADHRHRRRGHRLFRTVAGREPRLVPAHAHRRHRAGAPRHRPGQVRPPDGRPGRTVRPRHVPPQHLRRHRPQRGRRRRCDGAAAADRPPSDCRSTPASATSARTGPEVRVATSGRSTWACATSGSSPGATGSRTTRP